MQTGPSTIEFVGRQPLGQGPTCLTITEQPPISLKEHDSNSICLREISGFRVGSLW